MRIITIKCFNDGKSELTNMQYHFSGENKASKLVLDFSLVTHKNYHKWLDVLLRNGEYARYYLGQAEIVEKELTNELTIPGYITFAPFITDSEEENARKIKFQQQTVTIRTQLDAGSTTVTPKNDRLFELLKKTEELEENKLDKITKIGNELVDVIELLLSKANQTEILKLVQDIELDVSTGILTIEKYDGEKIVYDLPLEFTVADGYYDEISQEIVIVYTSGAQIRIPVSGLITQVNLRLSNLENEIEKFKDGTTKVKNAEFADKLTTKDPKVIERILWQDITASNDVEILDSQMSVKNAKIKKIAGIGVKQVLKNSEAEVLTTKTPVNYIEGNPTTVVDGQFVVSKPNQIISKSNNLFDRSKYVNLNNYILTETGFIRPAGNGSSISFEIPTTPNETYTIAYDRIGSGRFSIRDKETEIIIRETTTATIVTFVAIGNITRISFSTTSSDIGSMTEWSNVRLNEGTEALPYQPFAEHIYDLGEGVELLKLPNGVGDKWFSDGSVERNVGKYILQANDITAIVEGTSIQTIRINKPLDFKYYNNGGNSLEVSSAMLFPNFPPSATAKLNTLFEWNLVQMAIGVPVGTYPTLQDAKNALAGTEILYQLATPVIENAEPLPAYIDTYDGGTIYVDNGQGEKAGGIILGKLYSHNCQANTTYFVSAKLTDYTNARVTNGTTNYPLVNGYAKFTPTVAGEYWLEYVKDGVNKVSKAQWIEVYDPAVKTKTADELNALYSKFYNYGLTPSNVSKLVSSGDNWYKGEYSIVSPNVEYKVIGQDFTITFYDKDKNVISTTQSSTFTTPNNCIYVSSDKNDIALYLSSNPITEYLPYTEDIVEIPAFEGLSLPNGVRNTPEITRVWKVSYNGSENWSEYQNFTNNIVFRIPFGIQIVNRETSISNYHYYRYGSGYLDNTPGYSWLDNFNHIYIQIEKSKLSTQDVAGFKEYLSQNPITIWYELANYISNEVVWDKKYVAYNYGMEKLDGLAQIVTEYQLDLVSQTVTNTENITDNRKKIASLFEVINSQYKIEIYSSTDFSQVVRKPGILYGSYDVETKKIDWFFGD